MGPALEHLNGVTFSWGLCLETVLGSDGSTLGSVFLCLIGRYECEAYRRATLENDFVVLKKVSGFNCST